MKHTHLLVDFGDGPKRTLGQWMKSGDLDNPDSDWMPLGVLCIDRRANGSGRVGAMLAMVREADTRPYYVTVYGKISGEVFSPALDHRGFRMVFYASSVQDAVLRWEAELAKAGKGVKWHPDRVPPYHYLNGNDGNPLTIRKPALPGGGCARCVPDRRVAQRLNNPKGMTMKNIIYELAALLLRLLVVGAPGGLIGASLVGFIAPAATVVLFGVNIPALAGSLIAIWLFRRWCYLRPSRDELADLMIFAGLACELYGMRIDEAELQKGYPTWREDVAELQTRARGRQG